LVSNPTPATNLILRGRAQAPGLFISQLMSRHPGKPYFVYVLWSASGHKAYAELLCNLAFRVSNLRLPQFDRIPLRVMQAGEPAVGIRLRVNLHLDSSSL
jgi:hypothetical protein